MNAQDNTQEQPVYKYEHYANTTSESRDESLAAVGYQARSPSPPPPQKVIVAWRLFLRPYMVLSYITINARSIQYVYSVSQKNPP